MTAVLTAENTRYGNLILINGSHPLALSAPPPLTPVAEDYPNVLMEPKASACFYQLMQDTDQWGEIVPLCGYGLEEEHQSGLAVDLTESSCEDFRRLAGRYGFISRYTAGKSSLTGAPENPCHFRFVGYPHSSLMEDRGMCLEEYLEFLKQFTEEKPMVLLRGGKQILIYTAKPGAVIKEAPGTITEISGTNTGSCIITVWK